MIFGTEALKQKQGEEENEKVQHPAIMKEVMDQEIEKIKSSGIDFINGYSIKIAAPLIKDMFLILVKLTIKRLKYPKLWK